MSGRQGTDRRCALRWVRGLERRALGLDVVVFFLAVNCNLADESYTGAVTQGDGEFQAESPPACKLVWKHLESLFAQSGQPC